MNQKSKTRVKYAAMAFILFFSISCSNSRSEKSGENSDEQTASSRSTDCLFGKWFYDDSGQILTFEFKRDNTGLENIGSDDRHFSWTLKDGNPVIVYAGETNEWSLTLDCNNTVLSVFSLKYKKS
jgi:hypothetical protein